MIRLPLACLLVLGLLAMTLSKADAQAAQENVEAKTGSAAALRSKLEKIIIPKVEFNHAPLGQVLDYLRKQSVEHDTTETDPARKGSNIVVVSKESLNPYDSKITLSLTNVPLLEALRYVAGGAGMRYRIERHAAVILPYYFDDSPTREFRDIPKDFFQNQKGETLPPKEFLESKGIAFPPGTSVVFLPKSNKLVIRNAESTLDLIDEIVDGAQELEAKKRPDSKAGTTQYKLDHIIFPNIEFKNTPAGEVVAALKKMSTDLDSAETDPKRKGVNIFLSSKAVYGLNNVANIPKESPDLGPKITLALKNIPLGEALGYIAQVGDLRMQVLSSGVVFSKSPGNSDELMTVEFKAPASFTESMRVAATKSGTGAASKEISARDFLESCGVVFPKGSSAELDASKGKLTVRNTEANLDLVDQVVEAFVVEESQNAEKAAVH